MPLDKTDAQRLRKILRSFGLLRLSGFLDETVLMMPEFSDLSSVRHLLVIQPLVGIGDMLWHKPWIDRLTQTHRVTLMAKPTVQADVVFTGAPDRFSVAGLDRSLRGRRGRHDGLTGFWRLVMDMRAIRADAVVILHNSARYALAARLAGIRWRLGYGMGRQRRHLNAGYCLGKEMLGQHAIERIDEFAKLNGFGLDSPVWSVQPRAAALTRAKALLASWMMMTDQQTAKPFICIGIGSMNPERQWGASRFAELITRLTEARADRPCLILGGPGEQQLADDILTKLGTGGLTAPVFLGRLDEAVALMSLSDGYVGNDTSLLNFMACLNKPALGLFSHSRPLTYSPHIHKTEAVGEAAFGQPGIIRSITVNHVLDKFNSLWPEA